MKTTPWTVENNKTAMGFEDEDYPKPSETGWLTIAAGEKLHGKDRGEPRKEGKGRRKLKCQDRTAVVARVRRGDRGAAPDGREDGWRLNCSRNRPAPTSTSGLDNVMEQKAWKRLYQGSISNLEGTDDFSIYTLPAGEKESFYILLVNST